MAVLFLAIGIALGAAAVWLWARTALAAASEKLALVETARAEMATQFKGLSAEALERTVELAKGQFEQYRDSAAQELQRRHQSFEELVKPIRESLERVDGQVKTLEQARRQDFGTLTQHLRTLEQTTGSLATALRAPSVRGRWGELQLRNTVEAAGMQKHCDFEEQTTVTSEEGPWGQGGPP